VRRGLLGHALVAGAVVALDQWTKHWASHVLAFRPPVDVIGTLVRFTYTRNSGVAFGIGQGTGFPYYVFSIVAAIAIVWLLARGRIADPLRQWALALILGGAIGNLIDRVTTGEVVDFILLSWRQWSFPVFNVADSAVTTGVALFALATALMPEHDAKPAPADATAPPAGLHDPADAAEDPGGRDADDPGPAARRG
jgi:signal peptidase II